MLMKRGGRRMRRWMTGAALAGLALGLTGAGSAQPHGRATAATGHCIAGGGQLPADWSDRRKVVHLAVCEWSKFGFPVLEIRLASKAEEGALPSALGLSAPLLHAAPRRGAVYEAVTPALEVMSRSGRSESDASASAAIEGYWLPVRPSYVEGIREARRSVDRQQGGDRSFYPGWWEPWSAAFTSWVYQNAGISWFRGAASHVQYLKPAMTARPAQLVRIDRYRPLPGDLICAPRADSSGEPTAVSAEAFIEALNSGRDFFETHCDVVVRVNRNSVVAIGGNVKNSVTATVTPLRGGRLVRTNIRPWAAALTLGTPYDPCARMESVPLSGWADLAAERRRALARTGCRAVD
jgi:hypothetical protein